MRPILALLLLWSTAVAGSISFAWNPNAPEEKITHYTVYRISPIPRTKLLETPETRVTVDADDGDILVITASNVWGESDDSVPIYVRFFQNNPAVIVTFQASDDMNTWEDWQKFSFPAGGKKFFRLKIDKP